MPTEAPAATAAECEAHGGHAFPPDSTDPCTYCGTARPEPTAAEQRQATAERVVAEVVTEGRPAPSTEPDAPDADPEAIKGELVHLHPTGGSTGLVPIHDELRGMAELAVTLAQAGVMPKELRQNPANVLAVLVTGRELGVAPMTAIRTFHVIDGNVTVAPKVRAAMVRRQGLGRLFPHQPPRTKPDGTVERCPCGRDDGPNDAETCTWHAERADDPGIIYSSTYTIQQARAVTMAKWVQDGNVRKQVQATLADKDNWQHYPERMLSWRALGYLLDDTFPEVGTGLYSPDELGAVTDAEGEPVFDLDHTDPLVGTRGRASAGRAQPVQDPPPNPADLQALRERIDKLGTEDTAREALKALWMAPDSEGNPKLPPFGQLRHRHMVVAKGVVDAIERKAKAGEYGTDLQAMYGQQPATPPTAPAPGPEGAEGTEGAEDATEAHSGPQGGADETPAEPTTEPEPPPVFDEANLPALTELLREMKPPELRAELERRGLGTSGNGDTLRHRLGQAMIAEGWAPPPPDTLL